MSTLKTHEGGVIQKHRRKSSIELLRIISMYMILADHFVFHNAFDYRLIPPGFSRFFTHFFMASAGKIGVVIFFTISAWFFLERDQTLKSSFRRIWALEKEILFYSLILCVLFRAFAPEQMGLKLTLKSLLPLIFSLWWYPTAYATFLLFMPFLARGLRALGRRNHLVLCLVLLFIFGILTLMPGTQCVDGVWAFVTLFVLIAAYRWYLEDTRAFRPWVLILAGALLICAYVLASMAAAALLGLYTRFSISTKISLPVVLVGFGMFLLFERMSFQSRIIDAIAKSAFAVYLITDHPATRAVLWQGPLNLENFIAKPSDLLLSLVVLAGIYLACTLIDFVRRGLFKVAIDNVWGRLFDPVWEKAHEVGDMVLGRIGVS